MKTLVGKIVSLAAVISAAPLTSSATPPTLDNGVSRDLNHLTLLKGPNLTSPARPISTVDPTAPFAAPAPEIDSFRFVPNPPPEAGAVRRTGPGTVSLRKIDEPAAPSTPPAATQKKTLPAPESLRFDSTLHPPATPRAKIERVPESELKRD